MSTRDDNEFAHDWALPEAATESAAIQPAGDLPPLPEQPRTMMGRNIDYSADDMREYGQLCRDTKPESVTGTIESQSLHDILQGYALKYSSRISIIRFIDAELGYRTAPTVDAQPDAWMREDSEECTSAKSKRKMETAGYGEWDKVAASYTRPLYFRTPTVDAVSDNVSARDSAIRNSAFEFAAQEIEHFRDHCEPVEVTADECASAVRALKSAAPVQGKASDAEDGKRLDRIPLLGELKGAELALDGTGRNWMLMRDKENVRYLDEYERDFVFSAIDAARAQQQGEPK